MKSFIISIIAFFATAPVWGQLKIPEIKYTSNYKKIATNPLLQSLIEEGGIVIMYRSYTSWNMDKPARGIYYGKDKTWHYFSFFNKNGEKAITPIDLPQDSIIKIWNAFLDNDIFNLKDEKQIGDKCNEMIFDSQYINISIATKNSFKTLTYYDPAFFEEHCVSNKNRKKIINCAKVIFSHYYWQNVD